MAPERLVTTALGLGLAALLGMRIVAPRRLQLLLTSITYAMAAERPAVGGKTTAQPRPRPPPPASTLPDQKPKRVSAFAALKPREPLVPYEYDLPSTQPPPGYVDLAITHCGMCHSDVHQIDDAWKAACFPLVPGHEIVGTIAAIGDDEHSKSKFAVGDRACIGVQRGSCGECAQCQCCLENLCPKITKTYAGPGKDKGGFANLIRFPTSWTFKAPDSAPSAPFPRPSFGRPSPSLPPPPLAC